MLRFYYRVVLVIYRGIGGAIAVHTLGIDLTQADPQRPLSDPKETFQRAELLT